MPLALVLSVLIGASLGVLGGGGSILAVPVLTYVLHLEAKSAIGSSLIIVCLTSAAALVPRARLGLVSLRLGLGFGASAMIGAYTGGRLAALLPGELLLLGFTIAMTAAGVRLLRTPSCATREGSGTAAATTVGNAKSEDDVDSAPAFSWKMVFVGLGAGLITGLVGAGGGFVIVPALVLLGGMPMKRAIATSLLVITMNALAGFIAYTGHVSIDWAIVGPLTGMGVLGSIAGGFWGCRLNQRMLRTGFAWFIIAMAIFMFAHQISPAVRDSSLYTMVFVERWPWWVGGIAISLVVVGLLLTENKQLGVSTGCAELCDLPRDRALRGSWRPRFLLGIVLGGAMAAVLSRAEPTFAMGALDAIVGGSPLTKLGLLFGGGVLIGFGARLAGGCTSGHGIVGTALGARSSWVATALFMIAGFVTTNVLYLITKG